VREALSKKFIRPEDAVQNALEEIARDITIIEPDPKDWGGGWVTCWRNWKIKLRSVD